MYCGNLNWVTIGLFSLTLPHSTSITKDKRIKISYEKNMFFGLQWLVARAIILSSTGEKFLLNCNLLGEEIIC